MARTRTQHSPTRSEWHPLTAAEREDCERRWNRWMEQAAKDAPREHAALVAAMNRTTT